MTHPLQAATYTFKEFAGSRLLILLQGHRVFVNRSRQYLAVGVFVLMLVLVAGAGKSHAADLTWTNNGSDFWQSTTAWDGAPAFPGSGDNAFFTNAATYTVTLNSSNT